MKKVGGLLFTTLLVLQILTGCAKEETVSLSPELTNVVMENGVGIDVGEYVMDEEMALSVEELPVEENAEEGYRIEAYDINLGEMTELDDFITLTIPYDPAYFEEGQDPATHVAAKYKNETSGEWEDVLYEVDTQNNELLIYTDHLSTYGAFYVSDVGKRNAKITNVKLEMTNIAEEEAVAALSEYVNNGGQSGDVNAGLGAKILDSYNGFLGDIGSVTGETGLATDAVGTVVTMAGLGKANFDSALATATYDKLGNLGKVAAAVKIGSVMLSTEKTDADILGLYKDTAMYALSFAESRALGLASSSLFLFDYTITQLFEQGQTMKMDKINEVYRYFNDEFSGKLNEGTGEGSAWQARSMKDWRTLLIEIAEKNPNEADAQAAIEAEIDTYAEAFWKLGDMEQAAVVTDMKEKTDAGSVRIPDPTEAEIKTLAEGYKAYLYRRLEPVVQSVSNYMQRKAESEYLVALNDLKTFFNQKLTVKIVEETQSNQDVSYDGNTIRFAPLSEQAVKADWTGKLKEDKNMSTTMTLLGYIQAGCPSEIQLFKPDADVEQDEPERVIPFTLSAPETVVDLGGLPLEAVLGRYTITFTLENDGEIENETIGFEFIQHEQGLFFMPDKTDFGFGNAVRMLLMAPGTYEYDPGNATAIAKVANDNFDMTGTVQFTQEQGTIKLTTQSIYNGDSVITINGVGTQTE